VLSYQSLVLLFLQDDVFQIIRVFEAPRAFLESLRDISGVVESEEVLESRPVGATIPALGLSNKAISEGDISNQTNKSLFFDLFYTT
jgi:hypothetical protein